MKILNTKILFGIPYKYVYLSLSDSYNNSCKALVIFLLNTLNFLVLTVSHLLHLSVIHKFHFQINEWILILNLFDCLYSPSWHDSRGSGIENNGEPRSGRCFPKSQNSNSHHGCKFLYNLFRTI